MFARFVPRVGVPSFVKNLPEYKIALKWAEFGFTQLPKLIAWGAPAAVFAGWMVYPALTPQFKGSLGLEDNIKPANIKYEEELGSCPTVA
mmetsp:Transcript_31623/g.23445  ORF Transcript_31623/g.23445 Transcript_31623/m.23445 type:complete len:90 (-) Transcript_31623:102-371(-)|eukprot:CAMPEP_0202971546 /NCGR_PEP_ID=MMETSP1396-20130829/28361_1 /ASSEMBLY_ACC=CAM_ASM_000872 /TAXON_ID= /ORGANISM="Pseudokeronopsis sp., Strain Brazil" /LENGTH=89 /DNA_ID=CAMNT_0049701037 /DNA_START=72 /DNA_END=341 /DNA_ORIENTATION=-